MPTRNSKNENPVEFWVEVVIEEYLDEYGRECRKTKWQKSDSPIELGSVKFPKNKNIVGFKWVEQAPTKNFFSLFDRK